MADDELEDLTALLPPLLASLEALGFIGRHLHPPHLDSVLEAVGAPDEPLRAVYPRLEAWPERLSGLNARLSRACEAVMGAFDGLRDAPQSEAGLMAAYRALGQVPRAQEALYPLAAGLPPINRYFLDPASGRGEDLQARSLGEANPDTGVFHVKSEPGDRGGFSMYVPEYYTPDRAWPLVMALHGGSGNGRNFLWSWLRTARAHGAILAAPTASGETWALNARDADTPLLARIVDGAKGRWNIDPGRVLMTGMSDGGTFSYLSGLRSGSPFTHLAPISAAFHPMMVEFADEDRIKGLPIFLTHGALDWMFPIQTAREASRLLAAAGAKVTFHEIDDLSHTYPREINWPILEWMEAQPAA